ncbi:MAG: hypothetical protein QG597_928 [Actinomycetota bacterium]|nr:hypothetical protein [Actinomycetota bacterium]
MTPAASAGGQVRPLPTEVRDEAEFRRWYWTVAELRGMARGLQVSTSGTKSLLTERIAARLAGREMPVDSPSRRTRMATPLTGNSVIPAGVVLDRHLREWFQHTIGPGFRSDHHLRSFLQENPGATLGDAVAHWHATRDAAPPAIGAQFEYNRFVRRWRHEHPTATHVDVVRAWQQYRARPADDR